MQRSFAIAAFAAFTAVAASAQPTDLPLAAATTTTYPPGVKVIATEIGQAYANSKGLTLYGLDMRTLLRSGPNPALYCTGACAELWEPLLALKGAAVNIAFPQNNNPNAVLPAGFVTPQKAPDWTVIAGPQGPQWVYKGWHLVFTRRGAAKAAVAFDGAESRSWNVLRFVPPMPIIVAPSRVKAVFADGAYHLADIDGRPLFTGTCAATCTWQPFAGGMASAGIGDWTINTSGDVPQWTLRGAPVFVGSAVPVDGKAVRP